MAYIKKHTPVYVVVITRTSGTDIIETRVPGTALSRGNALRYLESEARYLERNGYYLDTERESYGDWEGYFEHPDGNKRAYLRLQKSAMMQ